MSDAGTPGSAAEAPESAGEAQGPVAGTPVVAHESVSRWLPPPVEGRVLERRVARPTAAALEGIERAAWDEGHALGREEGLAAGAAEIKRRNDEIDRRIARFDQMIALLARPLAELDTEVEQQLATLALTVARHVVRRELRADPHQIIGILRDTVALLPAATRDVSVRLHPDDAALVEEKLAPAGGVQAWTLVSDPTMTRGGCRVTADRSHIDARVESRLHAAVAQILGDDRTDRDSA